MPLDDVGDGVLADAEVAGDPTVVPPPVDSMEHLRGEAARQRTRAGLPGESELLGYLSPLGWGHILLTGEYRWPRRR